MVKVIERGKPKYRAICPSCNSVLEYTGEDLEEQIDRGMCYAEWVYCPVCGGVIVHSKDNAIAKKQ